MDHWALQNVGNPLAHLLPYPADGTKIADSGNGRVYVIAGGAPLYVSNWNNVPAPHTAVQVDHWALTNTGNPYAHLRTYPADGTKIADSGNGRVYVIAGGAPLYVSNWNNVPAPHTAVQVDHWALTNTGNPYAHLRTYPADGTKIADSGNGRVYVIAGGAPLYVSNWNNVPAPHTAVQVDHWALTSTGNPYAHLRTYPADGTKIADSGNGRVYVIAGGAPLYVSNWNNVPGPHTAVQVDHWALANTGNPYAHLRTYPADGTVVYARPSNTRWSFSPQCRSAAPKTSNGTGVSDSGLSPYPVCKSATLVRTSAPSETVLGSTSTLGAKVVDSATNTGLSAAPIRLERASHGSWSTVTSMLTTSKGLAAYSLTATETTTYRWYFPARSTATAHYAATTSSSFQVNVQVRPARPSIVGTPVVNRGSSGSRDAPISVKRRVGDG
ncbi:hypothetical protein [Acidipropionibacterium jensenii]|uniref:hypothetical protein n=1 Tax=Acidipropionibacterium jensenii TaxID=1749 RepID=UPI001F468FFF|nr:hypothetical protein [Acidipropionibacterium jensenii]